MLIGRAPSRQRQRVEGFDAIHDAMQHRDEILVLARSVASLFPLSQSDAAAGLPRNEAEAHWLSAKNKQDEALISDSNDCFYV